MKRILKAMLGALVLSCFSRVHILCEAMGCMNAKVMSNWAPTHAKNLLPVYFVKIVYTKVMLVTFWALVVIRISRRGLRANSIITRRNGGGRDTSKSLNSRLHWRYWERKYRPESSWKAR